MYWHRLLSSFVCKVRLVMPCPPASQDAQWRWARMYSGRRKVLRGPWGGSGPAQSVDQANGRWTVTIGQSRSNLASFKGGLWGSFRHRGTAPGPYAVVPTPTGARAWGGLGDRTSQLSV